MEEGDPPPLYDVLFEITVSLCERFPAYTPTEIRRTSVREIFLMIKRLNNYNEHQKKSKDKNGNKKIRRPAGDNWF